MLLDSGPCCLWKAPRLKNVSKVEEELGVSVGDLGELLARFRSGFQGDDDDGEMETKAEVSVHSVRT